MTTVTSLELTLSSDQLDTAIDYASNVILPQLKGSKPPDTSTNLWGNAGVLVSPIAEEPEPKQSIPCTFSTMPDEHGGNSVQSFLHTPLIEGLEPCDLGYLVSASKGILNLWRCDKPNNGVFDPLMVMHSQAVDVSVLSMDRMDDLLITATHGRSGSHIGLYSLETSHIFTLKGNIEANAGHEYRHVLSLRGMGGPLITCLVGSIGRGFAVFDLSTSTKAPKVYVEAHTDKVSSIGSWDSSVEIITGCADGTVSIWDMRAPPRTPITSMRGHSRVVTSIDVLDDCHIITGSADTSVAAWDTRNSSSPLHAISPDSSSLLCISSSGNSAMCCTMNGLQLLDLDTWAVECLNDSTSHTYSTWINDVAIVGDVSGVLKMYYPPPGGYDL